VPCRSKRRSQRGGEIVGRRPPDSEGGAAGPEGVGRLSDDETFILIVTDQGTTRQVANEFKALDLETGVHEVMRPYDIVVELEAPNLTDVPAILSN
jgi:hypothetical protein